MKYSLTRRSVLLAGLVVMAVLAGCASGALNTQALSLDEPIQTPAPTKEQTTVVKPKDETPPNAQTLSLAQAIQSAVSDIEGNLEAGTKIAVVNLQSASESFSDYMIGELISALVSGRKLDVVTRQEIEHIRNEQDFNSSGEVSDKSAQRIGRMLGAQVIVTGSFGKETDSTYRLLVNAITVEEARYAVSKRISVSGQDEQVVFLLTGERTEAVNPTTAQTPTPAQEATTVVKPNTAQEQKDETLPAVATTQTSISKPTQAQEQTSVVKPNTAPTQTTVVKPNPVPDKEPTNAADFEFKIQGTGASRTVTITKYMGTATWVVIPDKINDIPVTEIGYYAFGGRSSLTRITSITIPSSVTAIGDSTFSGCSSLTSITIPPSVTTIEMQAFSGCSSLSSVSIPSSVTVIGNGVFAGCSSLTSITILSSVTMIGSTAFSQCRSLTSVVIPSSVTTIGSSAFQLCDRLTNVTLSRKTRVGDYAFPTGVPIRYSD
ncbi:hypothetical protein FACS1894200_06300 [Spirochaetia bacterium]|nr:hypothetical protein FACS1894200_06260 [Spirochaetia bacterium]GHU48702.1 hypothetical protein FACS1894200_06300 [Spirochaetia bacterium]